MVQYKRMLADVDKRIVKYMQAMVIIHAENKKTTKKDYCYI